MVLIASQLSGWFRWEVNALSQLGVGNVAILFNSAIFIGGCLNTVFAMGLHHSLQGGALKHVGIMFFVVSSICFAMVAIFTVTYPVLHGLFALNYFISAPVSIILIGIQSPDQEMRTLSLGCGLAALFAILALPFILLLAPFSVGFAVPELIEGVILAVWTIWMSIHLFQK
jgi:hypothetical membrane protein